MNKEACKYCSRELDAPNDESCANEDCPAPKRPLATLPHAESPKLAEDSDVK